MSRLVLMEVAMREELPELYDIYFGGKLILHYVEGKIEGDIPFIVVGATDHMGQNAALELMSGCAQLKAYHKHLFGFDVKSFVTVDKKLKKVKNWWLYFHPGGLYF